MAPQEKITQLMVAGNTEGRDKRIDLIILVGKGFFKIASGVP